jgi:hypothetical protein
MKVIKKWRVEERVVVQAYTYVYAPTKEEAQKKLENEEHEPDLDNALDYDVDDTDWDTLEECGECKHMTIGKKSYRCFTCGYVVDGGDHKTPDDGPKPLTNSIMR